MVDQPPRGRLGTVGRAQRDVDIWRMRVQGMHLSEIAEETGLTVGRVSQICTKALDEQKAMWADKMAELVIERRAMALASLDEQERQVWAVVKRRHFVINAGIVVSMPKFTADGDLLVTLDGEDVREPIEDDKPILEAINGALDKINKRRAALLGLDAPTRVESTGTYSYTVNGVDPEAMK